MYDWEVASAIASPSRRRTQAQRREATRVAVLDATIDSLAQDGYAQTTMRAVAERAQVTPGALQHHFETKVELLGQARQHLGRRIWREVLADLPTHVASAQLRNEVMLDRWWRVCGGPGFHALVELWVASRTDDDLRRRLAQAEVENAHLYGEGARLIYPELAEHPRFGELMTTGLATMRGLAMLRFVNRAAAEQAWPATRAHLMALFAQLSETADVS
jgi:AcrR family transcriptional regulator